MRAAAAKAVERLAREWSRYGFDAGRPAVDELRLRLKGDGGRLLGSVVAKDGHGNSLVAKRSQKIVAASPSVRIVVDGPRWVVSTHEGPTAWVSFVANLDEDGTVSDATPASVERKQLSESVRPVIHVRKIPVEPSWLIGFACGLAALLVLPHDALPGWLRLVLITAASLVGSFGAMAVAGRLRRREQVAKVLAARAGLDRELGAVSSEWMTRELDPGWSPATEAMNAFVLAHAEASDRIEALGPKSHRLCDADVADARRSLEQAQKLWREVSRG